MLVADSDYGGVPVQGILAVVRRCDVVLNVSAWSRDFRLSRKRSRLSSALLPYFLSRKSPKNSPAHLTVDADVSFAQDGSERSLRSEAFLPTSMTEANIKSIGKTKNLRMIISPTLYSCRRGAGIS